MAKPDETIVAKGLELLEKYQPKVTLNIKGVVDDTSIGPNGEEGTPMKILTLGEQITATGTIPVANGSLPTIKSVNVYCAGEDVALLAVGLKEKDGKLVYEGTMKLDVSKPKFGRRNGKIVPTAPSRIWLTSVSFARKGRLLSQNNRTEQQNAVDKLFGQGGEAVDMDAYLKRIEEEAKKQAEAAATITRKEVVVSP